MLDKKYFSEISMSIYKQSSFLQTILTGLLGAALTLLATSINPFPPTPPGVYFESVGEWFVNPYFGGWLWACTITCVLSFVGGLIGITSAYKSYREHYLLLKFWGISWLALLAFLIKDRLFESPLAIAVLAFLGFCTLMVQLWLQARFTRSITNLPTGSR
ncbi:MAG: hypothetical protein AAGD96_22330 [Chloroflexota bacterium]